MFPLAALIAGDPAGAYRKGTLQKQAVDTGDVDAQAQAAAGNAYMGLFGPQQMPGQPPAGAAQPHPNMLATLLQRLQGGTPPGGPAPGAIPPSVPQQGPAPSPQTGGIFPGGGVMTGAQWNTPQGPQGMTVPPPQQAVPGASPMPGATPQPGPAPGLNSGLPTGGTGQQGLPNQGTPQLDWRTIVQQVIRANPGVKDPRVIAAAVDRFMPLMNQQTQQQWREMSLMLRQQQLDISEERARTAADLGSKRVDQAGERLDVAKGREARLTRESALRDDRQHQMLDMQRQRLEQQITTSKDRALLGQWRAVLDAQHKRATEIISSQAAGMDTKERKKLLDEEDKFYTDQIEQMKNNMQGAQPKAEPTGGETGTTVKTQPIPVTAPKPGEVRNGYRFKGGDPSKQESWEAVK